MTSVLDRYVELIGRTLKILNADSDFLNVQDVNTGEQFWIESTGRLLVFSEGNKEND